MLYEAAPNSQLFDIVRSAFDAGGTASILEAAKETEKLNAPVTYLQQKCLELDNPTGICEYDFDWEYDPDDPPVNCKFCGQAPGEGEVLDNEFNRNFRKGGG